MNIAEIDTPAFLARDVRYWRGFSGKTADDAYAEFARLYPWLAEQAITCLWCASNLTLYVPWDWRRE